MSLITERYTEFEQERRRIEVMSTDARREVEEAKAGVAKLKAALTASIHAGLPGTAIETEILKSETILRRAELRLAAIGEAGASPKLLELAEAVIDGADFATETAVAQMGEFDAKVLNLKDRLLALLAQRAQVERDHAEEVWLIRKVGDFLNVTLDWSRFIPSAPLRRRDQFCIEPKEIDNAMGRATNWLSLNS